jgi:tRNA threonylcarbamoyladenosine biosynthesis protein TsaB
LLLETSNQPGFVAVAEGPDLRGVCRLDESRRHARDLAPTVAALLSAAGWPPRDVAAVLVSRGPGSYTGLRVGLMSAKAFAYATGCALVAVETFTVLAAQAPADVPRLAVVADAQKDNIYLQEFRRGAPGEPLTASAALSIQPAAAWLHSRPEPWWITGPGLRKLADRLPPTVTPLEPARWDPQPEALLQVGWERYQQGQRDDVWAVEPLYLRPSAAEEQWAARP